MNVTNDLFTATITESPHKTALVAEAVQPMQKVAPVQNETGLNTGENYQSLLASTHQMQQSGTSDAGIQAFISSELNPGVESKLSAEQSKGQFVDIFS